MSADGTALTADGTAPDGTAPEPTAPDGTARRTSDGTAQDGTARRTSDGTAHYVMEPPSYVMEPPDVQEIMPRYVHLSSATGGAGLAILVLPAQPTRRSPPPDSPLRRSVDASTRNH